MCPSFTMLHVCSYIILLFYLTCTVYNRWMNVEVWRISPLEPYLLNTHSVISLSRYNFFIFLILTSFLVCSVLGRVWYFFYLSRYWLAYHSKVKKMKMTYFSLCLFYLWVEYLSASFDELRSHEAKCKQRKCFQFLIPAKMHNSNQEPGNSSVSYSSLSLGVNLRDQS